MLSSDMDDEEAGPSSVKSELDEFLYQFEASEINMGDIEFMYKSEIDEQSDQYDKDSDEWSWHENTEIDEKYESPSPTPSVGTFSTDKLGTIGKLNRTELPTDFQIKWEVNPPADVTHIHFTEQPGLRVLPPYDAKPIDYFYMLATDSFFELICTEINIRAVELFLERAESRMSSWRDITKAELKTFLGLLFHMGAVQCSRLEDYWKSHRLFGIPCFQKYMKKSRFLLILKCFHFQHSSEEEDPVSYEHVDQVTPIVNFFNERMETIYTPHKQLYLDEPMVFHRGKLLLIKENHHCGLKTLYALIDSNELILNFALCTVFPNNLGGELHSFKIVLNLMKNKLNRGHSIHTDKFYSTFKLAKHLLSLNTYCTGTLHPARSTIPDEVTNAKLNPGETICRYAQGVCIGKWNDKRDFMYISTEHDNTLVEDTNYGRDSKYKPKPMVELKKYTPSAKVQEQMLSYYTFARKSVSWYKKIGFHIIHMMVFNAYLLYNKYSGKKMPFYEFRLSIIETLLPADPNAPSGRKKRTINETLLEHFPSKCIKNDQRRTMRRKCKVCWNNHIRQDTQYFCSACEGSPGLCLEPCFKEFHMDIVNS